MRIAESKNGNPKSEIRNLMGGIAQLGERLVCNQVVSGSNPLTSTNGVRSQK